MWWIWNDSLCHNIYRIILIILIPNHKDNDVRIMFQILIWYFLLLKISPESLKCGFWDFDLAEGQGSWSFEGCKLQKGSSQLITCLCNHLTNFAVLMVSSSYFLNLSNPPWSEREREISVCPVNHYVWTECDSIFIYVIQLSSTSLCIHYIQKTLRKICLGM